MLLGTVGPARVVGAATLDGEEAALCRLVNDPRAQYGPAAGVATIDHVIADYADNARLGAAA